MSEDEFWDLIGKHVIRRSDGGIDASPLKDVLARMSPQKILGFDQRLTTYFFKSYTWRLWGAAYLIHGGAPDDTFDYFRSWLIGQGREVFTAAMEDPDSLADVATPEAIDDQLYGMAQEAFTAVTGEPLPPSGFKRPTLDKSLNFSDPREMSRAYPMLFAKFGSMYAPTPEDELLARCRKLAGADGWWTSNDVGGFFHRFRPHGAGLAEIYSGIEYGDEITKRLVAVMNIDGTTEGTTLQPNNLTPVDNEQALALVRRLCENVQNLAKEVGDDELADKFTASEFVIRAGERRSYQSTDLTDEAIEMLCDSAFSIIYDSAATATVMSKAVYTLVGYRPLAFYIQWPIRAGEFQTSDPFQPFFELWRRGVAWRFTTGKVVEVFTP